MIGVFDSGSGGLSVLAAIKKRAPNLDIVYFGDLANMPYGGRSQGELQAFTIAGLQLLRKQGAQQLVSACNSVSAAVIRPMMELFDVPVGEGVIEMVGPAVGELLARRLKRVAIIATPATVESGIYTRACAAVGIEAVMIACPNLAASIEFGDAVLTRVKVDDAVASIIGARVDAVLLGCTHYPFVRPLFEELFARYGLPNFEIVDPADAVAAEVVSRCGDAGSGVLKCIISAPSEIFEQRVRELFGEAEIVHS